MNSFGALPWISQSFVRRSTYITRNQRIHSLRCHISRSLSCTSDLRHLCIEHSLLIRINFESRQHVYLFDQQERRVLFSQLLRYLSKKFGRLRVLVRFSVQFDRFHLLILFNQVHGVLIEQLLDLNEAVLFGKINGQVPLVEQDAAIDGFLGIAELGVGVDSLLAKAHRLELFA